MRSLLSDQKVGRVQKRIVSTVRAGLVNDCLVAQLGIQRQIRAAISDGVFIQQNGSSKSLDGEGNILVIPGGVSSSPRDLKESTVSYS